MEAITARFSVPFEYPIVFRRGLFDPDDDTLARLLCRREARVHPVLVAVDDGVLRARPDLIESITAYAERHQSVMRLVGVPEIIAGGEACKNDPSLVERLHRRMHADGVDRHAFVLIVGGGAVLDMVGYAAGTCHRGVRVVRVPTTVLAQCDGGVGVKTGINAVGSKNFLGTFTPPWAVAIDPTFIGGLEPRDKRAGLVEVLKVALIKDAELFRWMEANIDALAAFEGSAMEHAIKKGAELHVGHIMGAGDPFELGSARPLDFGHWAAHRLEVLSEHRLRHGEAVAIGIAIDCRYAELAGWLAREDRSRIISVLERLGLALHDPTLEATEGGHLAVMRGLAEFREHLGGELTVTMLEGIGQPRDVHTVDDARMNDALGWLRNRKVS